MTKMIQTISNWLITNRTITMPGWAWLISVPVAIVILLIIAYVVTYLSFLKAVRLF